MSSNMRKPAENKGTDLLRGYLQIAVFQASLIFQKILPDAVNS